jgi:hypothetical protein
MFFASFHEADRITRISPVNSLIPHPFSRIPILPTSGRSIFLLQSSSRIAAAFLSSVRRTVRSALAISFATQVLLVTQQVLSSHSAFGCAIAFSKV